jgi:hypothetical protein
MHGAVRTKSIKSLLLDTTQLVEQTLDAHPHGEHLFVGWGCYDFEEIVIFQQRVYVFLGA